MKRVKLTIIESKCRCNYFIKGESYIVEDKCPPFCMELWNQIYPYVFALKNGGDLDYGSTRSKEFDMKCPDGGRVVIHGEIVE